GQQYLGTVTSWPVGYTRVHATPGGLVALAWNGTNVLHGLLVSATGALFLCDVDAQSGSVTPIGAGIGFDGITALTVADGRLWGCGCAGQRRAGAAPRRQPRRPRRRPLHDRPEQRPGHAGLGLSAERAYPWRSGLRRLDRSLRRGLCCDDCAAGPRHARSG